MSLLLSHSAHSLVPLLYTFIFKKIIQWYNSTGIIFTALSFFRSFRLKMTVVPFFLNGTTTPKNGTTPGILLNHFYLPKSALILLNT